MYWFWTFSVCSLSNPIRTIFHFLMALDILHDHVCSCVISCDTVQSAIRHRMPRISFLPPPDGSIVITLPHLLQFDVMLLFSSCLSFCPICVCESTICHWNILPWLIGIVFMKMPSKYPVPFYLFPEVLFCGYWGAVNAMLCIIKYQLVVQEPQCLCKVGITCCKSIYNIDITCCMSIGGSLFYLKNRDMFSFLQYNEVNKSILHYFIFTVR